MAVIDGVFGVRCPCDEQMHARHFSIVTLD